MKSYSKYITDLKDDEVFCFTSNLEGFHGAGSAGYASFGEFGNVWRKYDYHLKPDGWLGKWNIKGQSEGLQQGREGKSYAIPSVTKPGAKRSIPKKQLKQNIQKFYRFAESMPDWKFYVAQDAKPGYNGYSVEEMVEMWSVEHPPDNVYFYEPFYNLLKERFNLHHILSDAAS
jgi:hypothetical protein